MSTATGRRTAEGLCVAERQHAGLPKCKPAGFRTRPERFNIQGMEIILSSPRSASARDPGVRGLLLTGPVARTSLGDLVAERLRAAILNSELSPGQLLREARISESLGVSRSPVHAAFLMLEHEGLVTLSRHRGATVVQLSAEDLGEVHSLRLVIEELAVRLAIQRRDEADLKVLERSLAGLRPHLEHSVTEQMSAQLDVTSTTTSTVRPTMTGSTGAGRPSGCRCTGSCCCERSPARAGTRT